MSPLPRLLLPLLGLAVPGIGLQADDTGLTGRLYTEDGATPLAAVRVFASPRDGSHGRAARTWEMEPRGWWKAEIASGPVAVAFTGPAQFVRPLVFPEVPAPGALKARGRFDLAGFPEKEWDRKPARAYFQTFLARSRSVTQAGFKLATDGVDGAGPLGQDFVLSVHRCTGPDPLAWPQVGPAMPVPQVDCGGPKSYAYSAGWDSGSVPLEAGKLYALQIRPARSEAFCQAFWSAPEDSGPASWRLSDAGWERIPRRLWVTIAGDGDGLLIPMNKRVHREFGEFAGFARRWTQPWTSRGRSLAGVFLYAATSGIQKPMDQQRVRVRIRADGPEGAPIGPAKIAAGQCNYTGDASWGVFGAVYAPGEIALEPGRRYVADFETLETPESIGDFVNIKGQRSDGRPGFNPYRRPGADPSPAAPASKEGVPSPHTLDMQVIEFEGSGPARER